MPTKRFSGAGLADDESLEGETQELTRAGEYELETQTSIPSVLKLVADWKSAHGVEPAELTDADATEILEFCRYHDINRDEAAQLTAPGSHKTTAQRGSWQNILLNLLNYQEGDPESERSGRIPIAEIHVPAITNCECRYKQESSDSKKAGLKVKIRGVGGGGGIETKVTLSSAITSPKCAQVTVPGVYQVTPWYNPDSRSQIDLVDFKRFAPESVGLRPVPTDRHHPCSPGVAGPLAALNADKTAVFAVHPLETPGSTITLSQVVESTRELTLDIDGLLEMKSQFIRGFSYEWKIVGAAKYLRFFEDDRSHVHFWCWDPGATA